MEINHGRVYHSKLKKVGHTYGAVYYGKLEFTVVNFLYCDLNQWLHKVYPHSLILSYLIK